MKKLIASVLTFALALTMSPINLIAAGRAMQPGGVISGIASVDGKPLANVTVRLRNVDNGQLVGTTTSTPQGKFSFTGIGAGTFVIETVAANGTILGTSAAVSLAAGAMGATDVAVLTSATALAAAGGIGGAAAAGAAAGAAGAGAATGGALGGTLGLVGLTAGLIGATTLVVVANDASPSK